MSNEAECHFLELPFGLLLLLAARSEKAIAKFVANLECRDATILRFALAYRCFLHKAQGTGIFEMGSRYLDEGTKSMICAKTQDLV